MAEFLKGKVDESLTALVQPAGLVPAGLFAALNLAFVVPELRADEVGVATAYGALDPTAQAVVVGTFVLVIGYLLVSLSSNLLDVLAGEGWQNSLLYRTLTRRVKQRLSSQSFQPPDADDFQSLSQKFALWAAYPVSEAVLTRDDFKPVAADLAQVGPTAIGNALRASQLRLARRYGLDIVALGTQLRAVMDKDSVAASALADARASLDTLVNTAAVLVLFAGEGLVIHSARGDWTAAWASALALPAAYAAYRAAVPKVRAWGEALEVAADLSRGDLRTKLGLREPTSPKDERELWKRASQVLLWGQRGPDPDTIFALKEKPAPTAATITASAGITVAPRTDTVVALPVTPARRGEQLELVFLVSNPDLAPDAFVAVSDTRTPSLHEPPDVARHPAGPLAPPVLLQQGGGDAVIVSLPGDFHSGLLSVQLPIWEVSVTGVRMTAVDRGADGRRFECSLVAATGAQGPAASPTLRVMTAATSVAPTLIAVGPAPVVRTPSGVAGGEYEFTLPSPLPASVVISFDDPVVPQ